MITNDICNIQLILFGPCLARHQPLNLLKILLIYLMLDKVYLTVMAVRRRGRRVRNQLHLLYFITYSK